MKQLASDQAASSMSLSVSPLLLKQPSDKAMEMNTAELCQWLKDKNIPDEYIKCFERDKIDGSELAAYDDELLEGMGISERRVRIRILAQFRKI